MIEVFTYPTIYPDGTADWSVILFDFKSQSNFTKAIFKGLRAREDAELFAALNSSMSLEDL